jgi:hypothetical protein
MELLIFKGRDPLWLLFEVENFFVLDNIPPRFLIFIASFDMERVAWKWLEDAKALGLCTNWVEFVCSLPDHC